MTGTAFSPDRRGEGGGWLQELHRENRNVEAKIRQQLQFLRDRGYIEFLGEGRYRKRR